MLDGRFRGLPQQGRFPLGRNDRERLRRESCFLGRFPPLSCLLVGSNSRELGLREGRWLGHLIESLSQLSLSPLIWCLIHIAGMIGHLG